jgi:hypothetical protein
LTKIEFQSSKTLGKGKSSVEFLGDFVVGGELDSESCSAASPNYLGGWVDEGHI